MKRHCVLMPALSLAIFMTLFLATCAKANYLQSGTSGTIVGTSLQYTDLTFTDNRASVKIRNNGLTAYIAAETVLVVDSQGEPLMEFGPLAGEILGSGVTTFIARDTYPIINRMPARNTMHQVIWVNMTVTPR